MVFGEGPSCLLFFIAMSMTGAQVLQPQADVAVAVMGDGLGASVLDSFNLNNQAAGFVVKVKAVEDIIGSVLKDSTQASASASSALTSSASASASASASSAFALTSSAAYPTTTASAYAATTAKATTSAYAAANPTTTAAGLTAKTTAQATAQTIVVVPQTTAFAGCKPGFYTVNSSSIGAEPVCVVCQWGFWCEGGSNSVANACPAGSASAAFGAVSASACTPCQTLQQGSPYAYYAAAGSTMCSVCPQDHYCPTPQDVPIPCPEHTAAPQGVGSATECKCLSGFTCSYSKVLTVGIAMQTNATVQQLLSNTWLISSLQQAVEATVGPGANVTFMGFVVV